MADQSDEELLKEIRDQYEYFNSCWAPIRELGRQDITCLIEGPWSEEDRAARNPQGGPKRPCLNLDELSQYLNQAEGNIRQNKRAITVEPDGAGANDKTAELHQGLIRQIEYQCNAAEVYVGAYVEILRRSYGAFRIRRKYEGPRSMNQVLEIAPFQNPDCVLPDPDCKEKDYSDMERCFILDPMSKAKFRRKYPNAEVVDFTGEHQRQAPSWITDQNVLVCEYWKVHKKGRKLLQFGPNFDVAFLDELPEGVRIAKGDKIKPQLLLPGAPALDLHQQRTVDDPEVWMYLANGIEILERVKWTGEIKRYDGSTKKCGLQIPIVFGTGKEVFYQKTSSGSPERYIWSMIRMARDPLMLYCFARTAQAELAGQAPKAPWTAAVGQLEGFETDWDTANTSPKTVLYYHSKTEESGDQVLPPPQQARFEPPIQQYELLAAAAKQAIQSAIGISALSSGARSQNVEARSGVALKTLEAQTGDSNFHFVDSYKGMIKRAGRIVEDNLPLIYDTAREIAITQKDDTRKIVRINDPEFQERPGAPVQHLDIAQGDHALTVTEGPSKDSEREAVDDFAQSLIGNPQLIEMALQNPQSTAAKLLAMTIRLRDLGPLGDKIAEDISPPDPAEGQVPPQVKQALQKQQQMLQVAQEEVGKLTWMLKNRTQEKAMELESKRVIAADKNRTDMVVAALKAGAASAQAQLDAEMQRIEVMWDKLHESELAPGPDDPNNLGVHPEPLPQPADPQAAPTGTP